MTPFTVVGLFTGLTLDSPLRAGYRRRQILSFSENACMLASVRGNALREQSRGEREIQGREPRVLFLMPVAMGVTTGADIPMNSKMLKV